jgi:hypothetical protein
LRPSGKGSTRGFFLNKKFYLNKKIHLNKKIYLNKKIDLNKKFYINKKIGSTTVLYGRLVTAFRDIVSSETKPTMEKGLFMGVDFGEVQTVFF